MSTERLEIPWMVARDRAWLRAFLEAQYAPSDVERILDDFDSLYAPAGWVIRSLSIIGGTLSAVIERGDSHEH